MRIPIVALIILFSGLEASAQDNTSVFLQKSEDDWVMQSQNAFVLEDRQPKAPVHLLIIPKKLIKTSLDASPELLGEMLKLANDAARKYGIDESGFRTVINTNAEGGQHVSHLHFHVLGGRQMSWPPG